MRHFEREAKLNLGFLLLLFVVAPLALGAFAFVAFRGIETARVDACLDRGGSYDYEEGICDLHSSHPVPSAWARGSAVPYLLAAVACMALGCVAVSRPKFYADRVFKLVYLSALVALAVVLPLNIWRGLPPGFVYSIALVAGFGVLLLPVSGRMARR